METKNSTMSELKIGSYILVDGKPCKVVSMTKSKPGKHGAAKIRLDAASLIDNKKTSIVQSADARVEVPIIEKKEAQVISLADSKVQVMDVGTYETFEMDIPDEFKEKIVEGCTVIYWEMGVKMIKGIK